MTRGDPEWRLERVTTRDLIDARQPPHVDDRRAFVVSLGGAPNRRVEMVVTVRGPRHRIVYVTVRRQWVDVTADDRAAARAAVAPFIDTDLGEQARAALYAVGCTLAEQRGWV